VPGSVWTLSQMSTPLRYYWRPYYERVIGDLMGGRARHDPAFVRGHGNQRQRHPPTALGYLWQLLALTANPGNIAWLRELDHDTLVVTGDDDPVMPIANALLLARYIPRARLVVAGGEGHLLLMDGSSQALPAIHSFLEADAVEQSEAWQQAQVVDNEMLDRELRAHPTSLVNPIALVSAWVRDQQRRAAAPAA
jgi:poly(3-hydroxyoctanoate) depolymerase